MTDTSRITVRPETPADWAAIDEIHRQAFGQEDEARLVRALRDSGYVRLSLVAECDGQVVGHILYSSLAIVGESGRVEALSLAPMAVDPLCQRRGIGTQLVKESLRACAEAGHTIVLVLGHPEFYPRFGFSPQLAEPLASPFGGCDAWMALELTPGALTSVTGRVEFSPPFGTFEPSYARTLTLTDGLAMLATFFVAFLLVFSVVVYLVPKETRDALGIVLHVAAAALIIGLWTVLLRGISPLLKQAGPDVSSKAGRRHK